MGGSGGRSPPNREAAGRLGMGGSGGGGCPPQEVRKSQFASAGTVFERRCWDDLFRQIWGPSFPPPPNPQKRDLKRNSERNQLVLERRKKEKMEMPLFSIDDPLGMHERTYVRMQILSRHWQIAIF